jgi:hypothetical protein
MNFFWSCFEKPETFDEEEIEDDQMIKEKASTFRFHKVSRFSNPIVDPKKTDALSLFENGKLSVIHLYNGG